MKEIRDICLAYKEALVAGKRTALATVVGVEGSSYRMPGARMLVTEDGKITGAISGGCLEGDALRKAQLAIEQGRNKLAVYDTNDDDMAEFGIQLGCRGVVTILFEPVLQHKTDNPIVLLERVISARRPAVLALAFADPADGDHPGTCMVFEGKEAAPSSAHDPLTAVLYESSGEALAKKTSFFSKEFVGGRTLTVFCDYKTPPVALIIGGAGNDALPILQLAQSQGWQVTIVDGRATHANAKRFKSADAIRLVKAGKPLDEVECDRWTACVLMSHNYNFDKALLREMLHRECFYIGMLGPRSKLQEVITDLKKENIVVSDQQKAKIYGPAGLDIGAETPEEIALSIVAEIKAVAERKSGSFLRDRNLPIHTRPVKAHV